MNYNMGQKMIIANWKSNKTADEAQIWIEELGKSEFDFENREIIICPSFSLLSPLKIKIEKEGLPIKLGAQDISMFDQGAFTGEVNGEQIKEFADYVLVGHSERRSHFSEQKEILAKKVEMAKKYNLIPIYFTPDENEVVPQGVKIIVYEPPSAISTSLNPTIESPQEADRIAGLIKANHQEAKILYGGSVSSSNASEFLKTPNITGVVVGRASLSSESFLEIVKTC